MQAFSSPTSSAMPLPDMPFSAAKASTPSLAGADAELELDVAVIGASVAGLLTAQGLARLGYRCALIGPDPVSTRKVPGFDPRIFALSPASWRWLQQQGLA
ncbi:MAG: FAD-dependent oxidoreductase, partial [Betaproteobacteria bacterium]